MRPSRVRRTRVRRQVPIDIVEDKKPAGLDLRQRKSSTGVAVAPVNDHEIQTSIGKTHRDLCVSGVRTIGVGNRLRLEYIIDIMPTVRPQLTGNHAMPFRIMLNTGQLPDAAGQPDRAATRSKLQPLVGRAKQRVKDLVRLPSEPGTPLVCPGMDFLNGTIKEIARVPVLEGPHALVHTPPSARLQEWPGVSACPILPTQTERVSCSSTNLMVITAGGPPDRLQGHS